MMTTEKFMKVMVDKEIHNYIWEQARRYSKNEEIQKEYVQEAWLVLSLAPADLSIDAYCELIQKTILSAYQQERRISGRRAKAKKSCIDIDRFQNPETEIANHFNSRAFDADEEVDYPWSDFDIVFEEVNGLDEDEDRFDSEGLPVGVDGKPAASN
jgi:hypothetical protein